MPGEHGPLAPLQEMRRHSHESVRASVARELALRKQRGVPTDDATDWRAELARADDIRAAAGGKDTAAYRKHLEDALVATRGALLEVPGYVPNPALTGISVRFRCVPRTVWWSSVGRRQELAARAVTGEAERAQLALEIEEAQGELVRHALVEMRGVEPEDLFSAIGAEPLTAEAIGTLALSGLLDAVFAAARDFQALDPEGRRRFGLQPPPTSESSDAIGAQSAIGGPLAAMAAQPLDSSKAPSTRPTLALAGTSSGTPGSAMPSPFGAPPTGERAASRPPS